MCRNLYFWVVPKPRDLGSRFTISRLLSPVHCFPSPYPIPCLLSPVSPVARLSCLSSPASHLLPPPSRDFLVRDGIFFSLLLSPFSRLLSPVSRLLSHVSCPLPHSSCPLFHSSCPLSYVSCPLFSSVQTFVVSGRVSCSPPLRLYAPPPPPPLTEGAQVCSLNI